MSIFPPLSLARFPSPKATGDRRAVSNRPFNFKATKSAFLSR